MRTRVTSGTSPRCLPYSIGGALSQNACDKPIKPPFSLFDVRDRTADPSLPAFCMGGNVYPVCLTGMPYIVHHGLEEATRYSFCTYDELLDHTALFVPARRVASLITLGPTWQVMEDVPLGNRMHMGDLVFLDEITCCAGGVITRIEKNTCFLRRDVVRVEVRGCWAAEEDGRQGHVFELDTSIDCVAETPRKAPMRWIFSSLACGMVDPEYPCWLRRHMIAFHLRRSGLYWS
jgi:hypothetical protein